VMTASFRVPGTLPGSGITTPATRPATVYLERLSDPGATVTNAIWTQDPATAETVPMYRIVDRANIAVVNREPPPPPSGVPPALPTVTRRPLPALWSWPTTIVPSTATNTISAADFYRSTSGAMWFPWSNRPFVSSTELLLVPGNDALGMLQSYVQPSTPTNLPALSANAIPNGLFDAVHVPTRFSGIHTTVSAANGMTALAAAGIYSEIGRAHV
jgi:hypothetical protein